MSKVSIKDLIFEGSKARMAAGATLATAGAVGTSAGKIAEEEAEARLNTMRQSLGGKMLEKLEGVKVEDTPEGQDLYKTKMLGKAIKELSTIGGIGGTALLTGALIAGMLSRQNKQGNLKK